MKSKGLRSTQVLILVVVALVLTPLACSPIVENLPTSEPSTPTPIAIEILGPAEVHGMFADVYGTWAGFPAAEVTIRLYAQEGSRYWCIQPAAASISGDQWTAAGQFGGVTTYGVFAVVASGDGNQLPGCADEPDQNYVTAANDDQFRAYIRPYVYLGDSRAISPRFVIARVE
jgi:hypothetical protein